MTGPNKTRRRLLPVAAALLGVSFSRGLLARGRKGSKRQGGKGSSGKGGTYKGGR